MSSHEFTLIVEGPDLQADEHQQALYEAGCSDAAVGRVGSIQYLDFDRSADSFSDAVFSAIEAVEQAVPGAQVVHLEPDDLVTMSDIAERTGRTRESVRLLVNGARGPGGFPPPTARFRSRQRLWMWNDVATWFATELRDVQTVGDPGTARFIAMLNDGLRWRRSREGMSERDLERFRRLAG